MTIESRLRRVEGLAGIEDRPLPALVIRPPYEQATIPHFPESPEPWITELRALDEARRTRTPCIFVADPYKEYEARHGLEPGTLSKHELCGKVPFAELLGKATGQPQAPDETQRNRMI